MLHEPWRVQLFGELRAVQNQQVVTRFYTQKIGSLFAYLAYHLHQNHPRESLIERFWPDADLEAGRMSLRTALASLRRQLELPDVPAGSVLIADRLSVRLNPENLTTDVGAFMQALEQAKRAETTPGRCERLRESAALYGGDLLPGCYDDWAVSARGHLAERYREALRTLCRDLERQGDPAQALGYARRAVESDPLDETMQMQLIRLYAAIGQRSAALRQYETLARLLRKELDALPERSFQEMVQEVTSSPPAVESAVPSVRQTVPAVEEETRLSADSEPTSPETGASLPPLPVPLTPFFGREEELARLVALLALPEVRVITLTGLGGTGKTRLALELARQLRTAGNEVHFVPLAEVVDALRLGEAIREGLRLETGNDDPLASIGAFLRERSSLLVLDNFEQIVEEGGATVRALLEACPQTRLLITSRLPLKVNGEWEFALMPLPTPAAPGAPERLLEFPSVRLFVHRAQSVRPDFQLTAGNAQSIAHLCRSLEGIPLALELAAARAQVLTPAQMMQHVTDRFRFLVGRQRDTVQRQRTLRAVLEWSYQALSEGQPPFFAQLAVFRGGWSLAAAEAICAEPLALDYLMDLRQASLIVTEEQGDEMRFRMLETVREFALERLEESGQWEAVRRRHRDYYLRLVEDSRIERGGPRQTFWLERLEAEHDNLRAVLDHCQQAPDGGEAGLRLVSMLDWFWDFRGHFSTAWERFVAALAHPGAQEATEARAAALVSAGMFAEMRGDFGMARELCEQSLRIMRDLGDLSGIASALGNLGSLARAQKDYATARRFFEEAIALWRELGIDGGVISINTNLGLIARDQGDYTQARARLTESLSWMRKTGNRQGIAVLLANLGCVELAEGYLEKAQTLFAEGLTLHKVQKNPLGIAGIMQNLAQVSRFRGDYPEARALYEESLGLVRTLGDRQSTASVLDQLALIATLRGELAEAWMLLSESLEVRRQMQDRYGLIETFHVASLALAATGQAERAATFWAVAIRLHDELAAVIWPILQEELDHQLEAIRSALGPEAFAVAWEAGWNMDWQEALERANALAEEPSSASVRKI